MSFVHLHCHSEYSLLDGANRIDDLIRRAQEFEQPALAITDHGNLHAAWEFQEKAKKAKLKPIIGMEAYVAPGDRRREGARRRPAPSRTTTSSSSPATSSGYRNLVKLSSLAYTEGFYSKPRVDRELLAKYSEGHHRLAPRAWPARSRSISMADDYDGAREAAALVRRRLQGPLLPRGAGARLRGPGEAQRRVFALAEELGLPVIATNDAHFLTARRPRRARRAALHRARQGLAATPTGCTTTAGLYFKSAPEIARALPGSARTSSRTRCKIADEVGVRVREEVPRPVVPAARRASRRENELLDDARDGGRQGALRRSAARRTCSERLDYELGVITKTGYAGYFLIVYDFIKAARDRGIPVGPGRGSAAGSLVAYALRITDVCPLKFDLLFERFLNPERVSMPDIDVDFCFERRGEVIEYVRQKYGKRVGRPDRHLRDDEVARRHQGRRPHARLHARRDRRAGEADPEPAELLAHGEGSDRADPRGRASCTRPTSAIAQLLDYAIALEGLSRHTGVHAAGVVIAPGPLDDYVPDLHAVVARARARATTSRSIVSQYDMNCLEKAGMLKMDFLGLTTLTVIHDALDVDRAAHRRRSSTSTRFRSTTRRSTRCCAPGARPACSSSSRRSRPTCCAACAATASTISSRRTR